MVNRNYTALSILVRLTFAHQNSNKETSQVAFKCLFDFVALFSSVAENVTQWRIGNISGSLCSATASEKLLHLGGWFRFQCSSNSFMIILFLRKYIDSNCKVLMLFSLEKE